MEPIGLLGGSFDPIHAGHLQLARDARDGLGLAEVRLIPAAQPWQKGPITDAAQRAHMVALAIAGEPGLVLDMHEIEHGGPTYTIDTLRALRAALGPAQPLVLVIGADQMARLDTWREWRSLLDFAHIAVAHRNAKPPALSPALQAFHDAHHADAGALQMQAQGTIVDLPMTPVDASATEIRALLSEPPAPSRDARLAALVPAPVLLYIRREGLYVPHAQLAAREKAKTKSMDLQKLQRIVVDALEDVKAQDIKVFNTIGLSDMFDRVVLASGTSNRQSRALAWSVVEKVKQAGGQVVSVEGTDPGEWVLVDLGDIVVHIMQPAIREYYGLEEMWGAKPVKIKLASEMRGNRPERTDAASGAARAGALPRQSGTRSRAKKSASKRTAAKTRGAQEARAGKAVVKSATAKPPAAKKSAAKSARTGTTVKNVAAARKAPVKKSAAARSPAKGAARKAAAPARKTSPPVAGKSASRAAPRKSLSPTAAKVAKKTPAAKKATSSKQSPPKKAAAKPVARGRSRS